MELLFGILVLAVIVGTAIVLNKDRDAPKPSRKATGHPSPPVIKPKAKSKPPARPHSDMAELIGPAYVVDGDSLVIKKTQIRIYGVDAPELNHPYGKKAKWAMVKLCKGHQVKAKFVETDGHGRSVAMCFLPDGRDLSEEMVKLGLALDWPKYSQGDYRTFEPPGVRKKLWLADARQKGRMHVWAQFDARQKERSADQSK